jgi:hypothetical protein
MASVNPLFVVPPAEDTCYVSQVSTGRSLDGPFEADGGVQFAVSIPDLPPKKDGARSMWVKPVQIDRLKLLRSKATEEIRKSGKAVPTGLVHLSVHIYCPARVGGP